MLVINLYKTASILPWIYPSWASFSALFLIDMSKNLTQIPYYNRQGESVNMDEGHILLQHHAFLLIKNDLA